MGKTITAEQFCDGWCKQWEKEGNVRRSAWFEHSVLSPGEVAA